MKQHILYEIRISHYGGAYYHPVRPTGRWKIRTGPNHEHCSELFIECKGFLRNTWISERGLLIAPKEQTTVFECGK